MLPQQLCVVCACCINTHASQIVCHNVPGSGLLLPLAYAFFLLAPALPAFSPATLQPNINQHNPT
jgi:hypothetical protein